MRMIEWLFGRSKKERESAPLTIDEVLLSGMKIRDLTNEQLLEVMKGMSLERMEYLHLCDEKMRRLIGSDERENDRKA